MENASHAFLDSVRKSMPHVRKTLGVTRVNPKLLTAAERLQMALAKEGVTIEEVERRTGHSRSLLRQELRGQRNDVFRSRESSLENYLEWLDANGLLASETLLSYGATGLSWFAGS